MEKKEAEALTLLRSGHEISLLERMEQLRLKQREAAAEQKEVLLESRRTAETRYAHYSRLLGNPVTSVPVGSKIPLRNASSKVSFENVSPADFESTGDEIGGLGIDLSKVVESIVDGIVAKTPLGNMRRRLKKINPLKKIPGLRKIGRFLDGLPTAGEFLADILPLKTITLDDFIDFLGGEGTTATVSREEFLEGLDALRMLLQEKGELRLMSEAQRFNKGAGNMRISAARWHQVPTATLSLAPIGMGISTSVGGSNIASAATASGERLNAQFSDLSLGANLSAKVSQYILREHDWTFQINLAAHEIMGMDRQLIAADLSIAIADQELANHRKQVQHAREIETFLSDKYTGQELYHWMTATISNIYFESYKLAYDLARRAERALRFELGATNNDYIQFGYWDSLKKGLLSGEKLYHDLKRLEVAYLEENYREFELTKHVSLNMLNPLALLRLKEEGRCDIELPEALFDCDYPGHYFRRIKSVSITIPAVTGPYTTVSCTLRLLRSSIRRLSTLPGGQYARDLDNEDPRFSDTFGAIQSIATSSGQNDSGLFELNFRDERYLPFEGAGVISRWQLELPNEFRQFDYDSISDVILHLSYTAREGGAALRDTANQHLHDAINALVTGENAPGLQQLFSIRHEFPTEFHRFLHPESESEQHLMTLNLGRDRFPYVFRGREIVVDSVHVYIQLSDAVTDPGSADAEFTMVHPGGEASLDFSAPSGTFGKLYQVSVSDLTNSGPGEWALSVVNVDGVFEGEQGQLNPEAVENIIFILNYTVAE
ncbi:MAG: hypothetical protein QNJ04_11795 [Desulfobacterales bacterium]|nr:hypothetical protein [Desulfobacterales bacterium]